MALHYVYQPMISGINRPHSLSRALTEPSEVTFYCQWSEKDQCTVIEAKKGKSCDPFSNTASFYGFEIPTVNSTFSRCPLGHSFQSKDWNAKPTHWCCVWKDRSRSVGKKYFYIYTYFSVQQGSSKTCKRQKKKCRDHEKGDYKSFFGPASDMLWGKQ